MSALMTTKIATRRLETGTGHTTDEGRRATGALATAKAIGLFVAAPFIGLVYIVLLPFVGLGTLAWFAGKALAAHRPALAHGLRSAAMIVAAPFIGLGFIVALTFAGPVMLVVFTLRALRTEPQAI